VPDASRSSGECMQINHNSSELTAQCSSILVLCFPPFLVNVA
jgi:hypothetical protein